MPSRQSHGFPVLLNARAETLLEVEVMEQYREQFVHHIKGVWFVSSSNRMGWDDSDELCLQMEITSVRALMIACMVHLGSTLCISVGAWVV